MPLEVIQQEEFYLLYGAPQSTGMDLGAISDMTAEERIWWTERLAKMSKQVSDKIKKAKS